MDTGTQYLTFAVGDEEYGVSILQAKEIIELGHITTVPNAPEHIRGVINLRGSVVPVVDLARKLLGDETPVGPRTGSVLVEIAGAGEATAMGLMTEAVGQVLALAPEDILPSPSFGAPVRTEFLAGMGRLGKKFALLLDIDRLLSQDELLAPAAIAAAAPVSEPAPAAEEQPS